MNYFKMAYRNLGRHRRRTLLSGLALAMGTARAADVHCRLFSGRNAQFNGDHPAAQYGASA